MARPPRWQSTLDASVEEACLAVRLYNDSAESRSFEGFVIHMHLAWLYLLHAEFLRDGVDYRYWDPQRKNRLLKIDGEAKRWELERSMRERWPLDTDPIRANLSLFIRLRNRLEHRHAHADEALMLNLAGHAHALLVNFEHELTGQFGDDSSLALRLRLPIFVGTFSPQGEQALRRFRKTLPKDLRAFLTEYESGLEESVINDARYEFRLRATVELAPKDPDAVAVQFTHYSDMTEAEREAVEEMGRRGQVIVRDRKQPVSGLGRVMPKPASAMIQDAIPFIFNLNHFAAAWRKLKVRPRPETRIRIGRTPTFASTTNPRSHTATRRPTYSISSRSAGRRKASWPRQACPRDHETKRHLPPNHDRGSFLESETGGRPTRSALRDVMSPSDARWPQPGRCGRQEPPE